MADSVPQAVAVLVLVWILWKMVKAVVAGSPLDILPGPPTASAITGNVAQILGPDGVAWQHEMVGTYGAVWKLHGLFGARQLYISDPLALHHILVQDKENYERSPFNVALGQVLFGPSILSSSNEQHKKQRKVLNPAFSSTVIKNLTPIFHRVAHELRDELKKHIKAGNEETNIAEWMSRAALEFIGQGGLGYPFNNISSPLGDEYAKAAKQVMPCIASFGAAVFAMPIYVRLGAARFRETIWGLVPSRRAKRLGKMIRTMEVTSKRILQSSRRKLAEDSLQEDPDMNQDLISILLKWSMSADSENRLSDKELSAQMNALIFAAFETSSTALSRILYLLCLHTEHQVRLRREVTEARAGADLPYDKLMTLPFLDAIVRETLRVYSPLARALRRSLQPTTLPLSTPITSTSGGTLHSVDVPADTLIFVGVQSCNVDPTIWGEDAEEWKPDRWIGKTVEQVAAQKLPGVYSGMMTFMGGPRSCLGFQFSLLEIKIVLSTLIEAFSFEIGDADIVWMNSNVIYPSVKGGDPAKAALPLRIKPVG